MYCIPVGEDKNKFVKKEAFDKEEYDLDAFLEELELSEHYHMWHTIITVNALGFLCCELELYGVHYLDNHHQALFTRPISYVL